MNTDTNELRDFSKFSKEELLQPLMMQDFIPIPDELQIAAKKKLNGKKSAYVSFNSGGKLSEWAKKVRNNIAKAKENK